MKSDFDDAIDGLYQLCRKVQKSGICTVGFEVQNFKEGETATVFVYEGLYVSRQTKLVKSFLITEWSSEEMDKAKAYLNKLLLDKPCPYCDEHEVECNEKG